MIKKLEDVSAVKEQEKGSNFLDVINRRMAIQTRRVKIKEIISGVNNDYDDKRRTAEAKAAQVIFYRQGIQDERKRAQTKSSYAPDESYMNVFEKNELERLQKAADDAAAIAVVAEDQYKQLQEESRQLSAELKELEFTLQIADVLAYQKKLKEAEQKVADIQALINHQQCIVDEAAANAQTATTLLKELEGQREDMLADIALGEGSKSNLIELDKHIAKVRETVEAEAQSPKNARSQTGAAIQSMAGLNRRISEADEELRALKAKRKEVISRFLMGKAEQVAGEYVSDALLLTEKFSQLAALSSLVRSFDNSTQLMSNDFESFCIPVFNLRTFKGLGYIHEQGQMAAAKSAVSRPGIEAAVKEQKKRIAEAGINL